MSSHTMDERVVWKEMLISLVPMGIKLWMRTKLIYEKKFKSMKGLYVNWWFIFRKVNTRHKYFAVVLFNFQINSSKFDLSVLRIISKARERQNLFQHHQRVQKLRKSWWNLNLRCLISIWRVCIRSPVRKHTLHVVRTPLPTDGGEQSIVDDSDVEKRRVMIWWNFSVMTHENILLSLELTWRYAACCSLYERGIIIEWTLSYGWV